jgi:nucleotide-binding universal stress UspA family protein
MKDYKILVPISFSASSGKALQKAVDQAEAFGGQLYVLNVYRQIPRIFDSPGGILYEKDLESLRKEAIKDLDYFVAARLRELRHRLNIEEVEVVSKEDPVKAILRVAREKKVDMIVLGHHDETRLEHMLFGRNVDKIIKDAPCDVIITRAELYKPEEERVAV